MTKIVCRGNLHQYFSHKLQSFFLMIQVCIPYAGQSWSQFYWVQWDLLPIKDCSFKVKITAKHPTYCFCRTQKGICKVMNFPSDKHAHNTMPSLLPSIPDASPSFINASETQHYQPWLLSNNRYREQTPLLWSCPSMLPGQQITSLHTELSGACQEIDD